MAQTTHNDGFGRGERANRWSAGETTRRAAAPRYLSGISIELSGHPTTGGFLELLVEDEVVDRVSLGPAPWTLMARLVEEATSADHWVDAFVPTSELERILGARGVIRPPTHQKVYNIISDIRRKLAAAKVRNLTAEAGTTGKRFAEEFLASETPHGYRIAVQREQMKLIIRNPTSRRDARRLGPDEERVR